MSPNLRHAFGKTIFCDDIRLEAAGKISLMGIYEGQMNVHVPFPVVLPKFALWVQCIVPSETMTEDGRLLISFPGEEKPVIEAEVPAEPLIKQRPPQRKPEDPEDTERWDTITLPFVMAPAIIRQPGRITVRMHIGKKTVVKLGTLLVSPAGSEPIAQAHIPLRS